MIKSYRIAFVVLITAFGLTEEVLSQELPFRAYSIQEGLSESVVHDLHQAGNGYLWIATGYGLNRFDGTEIRSWYRHQGLNDNQINIIAEDNSGRLWIGTGSGVNIMERDSILSPPYLDDLRPYSITTIHNDSNNDWWFGTDGAGVWLLDVNRGLTQYTTVHGLAGNHIRGITETADGILWFATSEGLTNLDAGNFNTFTVQHGLPDINLNTLASDGNGKLWIGTERGLSIRQDNEFKNFDKDDGLIHNSVVSISPKGDGTAWLGTEEGASYYENGSFRNFTVEQGLNSNIINSTLIDREGNIWFGTLGGGANIYLGDYFHNYTAEHGLTNNVVTGFNEDIHGHFWISTFGGGVMHYDGTDMHTHDESDGLIDNRVFTTYSDKAGNVWVGTRSGISIIRDGETRQPDEQFRDLEMIRAFFEDPDTGDFWIGTYNDGIYHYSGGELNNYNDSNYLENNTIMSIQRDDQGRIWFATYGGVVVWEDGEFSRYTIEDGLPSNGVISILLDRDGQAWVSTFNGFARFDLENRIAETFTSSFGLSTTLAYFMFQDHNDNYWIGTNIGIIRFDYDAYNAAGSTVERDLAFQLVNREQGLISNEMNAGGLYIDQANTVWLGTVEGVSRFFPERFPSRDVAPVSHFKEIVFAGQIVSPDQKITRRHDRNFLQFELTGISFAAPSQVMFEYRLEGVDDRWTHSYDRMVRYPSLSPGEYSFQLRAYNASGVRSETISSFDFEIAPPIWLQWWFFMLVGLIVIGIILFIYNYYRVRRLIEMERMRVQIASDLHDDVGASLTELALQTDFLRTGKLDEEVENTLKQIGEHSRRIVSTLDDIVWSIDARNDTAGDLTDRMQDHANKLLLPKGIMVNYNFANLDTNIQLPVQIKENLYLIFKESINNIAKHSNADMVNINLAINGNKYHMNVADNGTISTNGRKTGQGLRNINMRAKRMNANAIIERENGFNVKVAGSLN
jgi:ligand-binding sensor domain-containing protein/two-component sensor histidine kinase